MRSFLLAFTLFVIFDFKPTLGAPSTESILDGYHRLALALAHDDYKTTSQEAGGLVKETNTWLEKAGLTHAQRPHFAKVLEACSLIAATEKEVDQRLHFSTLSEGVVGYLRTETEIQKNYQLFFCPMVKTFAFWVQPKGEKIQNPYMGTQMLACGSKRPWM